MFLLIPEELVGTLLLFMLLGGGFAIMAGARRLGKTLIISAIAFPIISVVIFALLNDFFAAIPPGLVAPIAFVLMATLYLGVGWMIIKAIFGQKAVDHAKGEILADGARAGFRLLFSKVGAVTVFVLLTLAYVSFGRP